MGYPPPPQGEDQTVIVPVEETMPETTEPLRHRDFRLLWSGSATSQLGNISSATASPLLALVLTDSPVIAGWVAAASTIPSLLMYLPAGLFIDRGNRRRIMLVSQIARLAVALILVCGLPFVRHPAILLIIAAISSGTFAVFYTTAEITAVRRVVPEAMLPQAIAKNETRNHIALLVGRPLGGFLFGFSHLLPYVADAVTSVLSILALHLMKVQDFQPNHDGPTQTDSPLPPEYTVKQSMNSGTGGGLGKIAKDPFLRTSLLVCTVGNFFFQTVALLLVVLAKRDGFSSMLIGTFLATSGLGGLLGAVVATRVVHKRSPWTIVSVCLWAWLLLTTIVAVSNQPIVGLIAWGCLSFIGAHMNIALEIHQMTKVPEHLLGRVVSINRFLTSGAVPLGALSAGYIIKDLHPMGAARLVAFVIGAMAFTLSVPMLARSLAGRHLRDQLRKAVTWIESCVAGARSRRRPDAAAGFLPSQCEGSGITEEPRGHDKQWRRPSPDSQAVGAPGR